MTYIIPSIINELAINLKV